MAVEKLINVLGSIVTHGNVTMVVTGKNTAPVITAFGNAFSGSIKAAEGR
jgi:hypothetical protein